MSNQLEVLFTPAEFGALKQRDLSQTVCVVFDILRATSSMVAALAHGAEAIIPVTEISEAIAFQRKRPEVLLAGEREGLRIRAAQTGSIDFDLGNSPREFVAEKVDGKTIVMTTTNGTRALQACIGAEKVFVGAFLNLRSLADWLNNNAAKNLVMVCAGTGEEAAYEDALAAGALCDLIWKKYESGRSDSAQIAKQIYNSSQGNLPAAMQFSRNARRLLANPDLGDDVSFCLRRDVFNFLAELKDGTVRKII